MALKSLAKTTSMAPKLVGVGLVIVENQRKEKVFEKVVAGGPAANAGMLAGDVLIAVDDVFVEGLSLIAAANLCRGEEGSLVVLRVRRGSSSSSAEETFSLQRASLGSLPKQNVALHQTQSSEQPPVVQPATSQQRQQQQASTSPSGSPPSSQSPQLAPRQRESSASVKSFASVTSSSTSPGSLGLALEARNNEKTVASVHPNGPAAAAGLVVGDVIVSVDGVDMADITIRKAAFLLRGQAGSDAVLVVRKHSGEMEFTRVKRTPKLAEGQPLYFSGDVRCIRVTPDGARIVDVANLSLNGKTLQVGEWSCQLDGQQALRVGLLHFLMSVDGYSFAIVFPDPYDTHARIVTAFEKRLAGLARYRSTLPGSQFNTPCPEHEVRSFVERLPQLSEEDRRVYFDGMRVADPLFALQVATYWRNHGYEGDLYDRDIIDRAGRKVNNVVESLICTDENGTNPQAQRLVQLTDTLGEKVRAKAVMMEDILMRRVEQYAADMPEPDPSQIVHLTPGQLRAIDATKKVADSVAHASGAIASGVETVGRAVGAAVTQAVPPCEDARVVAAAQLAAAALGAVAGTVHALRDAAIVLLGGARRAAMAVVKKKYGQELSGALDKTVSLVGNMSSSALKVATPTVYAAGLAQGAARNIVLEAAQRVSRHTDLFGGLVLRKGRVQFKEFLHIWSTAECVLKPRALIVYPPDLHIPECEEQKVEDEENFQSTNATAEDSNNSRQKNSGGDDEEEEEEAEDQLVECSSEEGESTSSSSRPKSDSWVLVDGFVPVDRSPAAAGKRRWVGAERVIPMNAITVISLSNEDPCRFDIKIRGRIAVYSFCVSTPDLAQMWVRSLLNAAMVERKRVTNSWNGPRVQSNSFYHHRQSVPI